MQSQEQRPSPSLSSTDLVDLVMVSCQQYLRTLARYRLRQSLTTATFTWTEDGKWKLRAPVFQTLGAAKEEDMAEEDGSEERSAERVEERSYVRDKFALLWGEAQWCLPNVGLKKEK